MPVAGKKVLVGRREASRLRYRVVVGIKEIPMLPIIVAVERHVHHDPSVYTGREVVSGMRW
jgi:hypothetical protein